MCKLAVTSIPCMCSILVYFWARKVLMSSDLPQHKASLVQGYYGTILCYAMNLTIFILDRKSESCGQYLSTWWIIRKFNHSHKYTERFIPINEHTCMYVRHDNVYCECHISSHYGLWFWTVPYYMYYMQCETGLSTGFSGSSATECAVLYYTLPHRWSHNNCNSTA